MLTWSPDAGTKFQAYNGTTQSSPPPAPPQHPPGTNVNRNFDRLKWSVLDSPSKVEIFFLDSEDKPQWTLLSTDPIADEAATNPPQSCLQIRMEPLGSWEHWQQTEKEPPKPLLIINTDGQPISVK
ncbi:Nn.00g071250.m01.CDS01 [Neocucurbitaria sp. VM-36]